MRGVIISYELDKGLISGEDNCRYEFSGQNWRGKQPPFSGQNVDFMAEENVANTIFPLSGGQQYSIIILALVCWVLGVFGIHRFMVGKTGTGIVMLVLTCTIVGAFITAIWTIVDFIYIVTGNFTDKDGVKIQKRDF